MVSKRFSDRGAIIKEGIVRMRKVKQLLGLLLLLLTLVSCDTGKEFSVALPSDLLSQEKDDTSAQSQLDNMPVTQNTESDPSITEAPVTAYPAVSDTFFPIVTGTGPTVEYTPVKDNPSLKRIASLGENAVSTVSRYGDLLLLDYYELTEDPNAPQDFPACDERSVIELLDLRTGQITGSYTYDGSATALFLDNGNICIYQYMPLSVQVYDSTGSCIFRCTPEEDGQICIDPAGEGAAWFCHWDSQTVRRVPFNGETPIEFQMPGNGTGYLQTVIDSHAYLSATDDFGAAAVYRLSPDGAMEAYASLGSYYFQDDIYYLELDGSWRYVDPRQTDRVGSFYVAEEYAYLVSASQKRFCLQQYSEASNGEPQIKLILCLPESAKRTELTLFNQYVQAICWSEDEDRLYLIITEEDGYGLYAWDYQEASFDLLDTSVHTLTDAEKANLVFAQALQAQWGISIYFSAEDMVRAAPDYTAAPLNDPALIARKLKELSETLSDYPDGFFKELPYGDFDHLEIYLCGRLTPINEYGINTAIALSNTRGSALVIALDLNSISELSQTLAHELMHMMERRIEQIDPNLLADWAELTPGGESVYYYSYHDENGNEMSDGTHTWFYDYDLEAIYFVDPYSKSFPGEDRARIFEYLVEYGGAPLFLEAPVLRAKAERLCEIIRIAFPSVAAAEQVSWEIK